MENLSNSGVSARIKWFDENYLYVKERIDNAILHAGRSDGVRLLAATKTVPVEVINHAIASGIDLIGENKVQEMLSKYDALDKRAERHHIGRLQTNKVKNIVGKVSMIESVDSVHLAEEISKRSAALGITTDVLVEINIGDEKSKSGIAFESAQEFIEKLAPLDSIKVRGMMSIPPICENKAEICRYFDKMYKLFIDISCKKIDNISMDFLSMGMSGDFEEAIASGSNVIRLGSILFGQRVYQ